MMTKRKTSREYQNKVVSDDDDDDDQELNEADFIQELKQRRELDAENINPNANQIAVSNVTTKQEEEEDDKDKGFSRICVKRCYLQQIGVIALTLISNMMS